MSYVSSSKSNCLFNSASSVLYGNEDYTNRLRLAALLHGINNCDFYIKQVSITFSVYITYCMIRIFLFCVCIGSGEAGLGLQNTIYIHVM